MSQFAQPVSFYFSVSSAGADQSIPATHFQEVSGLEATVDVAQVVEGDENRFVHQLPKPANHGNLKLKRAITDSNNALVQWLKDALEIGFEKLIEPKDLTISLLNQDGKAVATWSVTNAYPVKWKVGAFDAMKNEFAIETVELAFQTAHRDL